MSNFPQSGFNSSRSLPLSNFVKEEFMMSSISFLVLKISYVVFIENSQLEVRFQWCILSREKINTLYTYI